MKRNDNASSMKIDFLKKIVTTKFEISIYNELKIKYI